MKLWLVGDVISFSAVTRENGQQNVTFIRGIDGIYDSREKALEFCDGGTNSFIAPLILNEEPSDEEWEGFEYPNA